MKFNLSRVLY